MLGVGGLFCAYSRMVSSILGLSPLGGRSTPDSQMRHPGMSADSAECPLGGKNHPLWKAGEGQAMPTALVSACAEQQAQDPLVRNRQNMPTTKATPNPQTKSRVTIYRQLIMCQALCIDYSSFSQQGNALFPIVWIKKL